MFRQYETNITETHVMYCLLFTGTASYLDIQHLPIIIILEVILTFNEEVDLIGNYYVFHIYTNQMDMISIGWHCA